MNFLNSTGFQTIIIAISVAVTLYLYWRNKIDKLQAATTILILQIRDIEQNIEYLKSEGITSEAINEQQLHYSKPIFEENVWDKHKYLFASRLSYSDFRAISQFYEVAQAIRIQQIAIKQKIYDGIYAKATAYYSQQFGRINICATDTQECKEGRCIADMKYVHELYNRPEFSVITFITKEFGNGLTKGLNRYQRLTGTTTFDNLCNVGRIHNI